jgi:hypothetical protein
LCLQLASQFVYLIPEHRHHRNDCRGCEGVERTEAGELEEAVHFVCCRQQRQSHGHKPGVHLIKRFYSSLTQTRYKPTFAPRKPFQSSLIFAGKARSLPEIAAPGQDPAFFADDV